MLGVGLPNHRKNLLNQNRIKKEPRHRCRGEVFEQKMLLGVG